MNTHTLKKQTSDLTGFKPMTSGILAKCSNKWVPKKPGSQSYICRYQRCAGEYIHHLLVYYQLTNEWLLVTLIAQLGSDPVKSEFF